MKKILIGIITYISFLIIYFIQTNFFNWFTIAGVSPNLFIILALFLGLFTSNYFALVLSVIIGLTIDFEVGRQFVGTTAIMLTIISVLSTYLDKNFSKDSRLTIIIMVILATIVYEIGLYGLNIFIFGFETEMGTFMKILLIEVLYNTIITSILYNPMRKLGNLLESYFKERNILTRYF